MKMEAFMKLAKGRVLLGVVGAALAVGIQVVRFVLRRSPWP